MTQTANEEYKIAVTGMAGVFPESDSVFQLWKNIVEKKILIREYTTGELSDDFLQSKLTQNESLVPFKGSINNLDCFDFEYFKLSKADATEIDPQQRILLQITYNALRDAGYDPENLRTRAIAVYASCSSSSYMKILEEAQGSTSDLLGSLGNFRDLIAARIAYTFNLHGPAVNIQTGCSSSLTAIYEATKSLLSNECSVAVVGSSSLRVPQNEGHIYQEGGIYSNDGMCRPFDERGTGTVSGNGCAAVILKRYEDAVADGDRIYCVINTILANNDGNRKASIAAPSIDGQKELIQEVLEVSQIGIDEIGFIETHGTGTRLGDPVEFEALKSAFGPYDEKVKCAIGSIKANIGHLDSTSGISGFIKAALSLYTGVYPPHPLFTIANSELKMENSPFYVNINPLILHAQEKRYGCVTSLGIGGTNVFAVLERVNKNLRPDLKDCKRFVPIDIFQTDQIVRWKDSIEEFLELHPQLFEDFTCQLSNKKTYKSGILIERVSGKTNYYLGKNLVTTKVAKIAFVFPGAGSFYKSCLSELVRACPEIDRILKLTIDDIEHAETKSLLQTIFNELVSERLFQEAVKNPQTNLLITFIINHVVGSFLTQNGVHPEIMLGHSLGEYNALVLAGILSLKDALRIVQKRGEIFSRINGFKILKVNCSREDIEKISEEIEIISITAKQNLSLVISETKIDYLIKTLLSLGIGYSIVPISVPAHSKHLDGYMAEFHKFVADFKFSNGKIKIVSNVNGQILNIDVNQWPTYLTNHLRQTVLFCDGIEKCISLGIDTFIQIGAGYDLVANIDCDRTLNKLSSIGNELDSEIGTLLSLKHLLNNDIEGPEQLRKPSPNYPFLRTKCWPEKKIILANKITPASHFIEVLSPIRLSAKFACKNMLDFPTYDDILTNSAPAAVLDWNLDFHVPENVFLLISMIRTLDKKLTIKKILYIVRSKNEHFVQL